VTDLSKKSKRKTKEVTVDASQLETVSPSKVANESEARVSKKLKRKRVDAQLLDVSDILVDANDSVEAAAKAKLKRSKKELENENVEAKVAKIKEKASMTNGCSVNGDTTSEEGENKDKKSKKPKENKPEEGVGKHAATNGETVVNGDAAVKSPVDDPGAFSKFRISQGLVARLNGNLF